ncbi:MAG: response regulator [Deltaproteobacteria bacterium]|jgi:two-component system chemotaxis response regulator CheY|nr:response regulator [Deltaproteobacteria bacterium]
MNDKKRILVVDDSAAVRQQVAIVLAEAGFEVVEAGDGVDGASVIATDRGIAMVICDVNMPRMNGLDMVTQVKKEAQNAALPIVMLTTEGQPAMIKQAKDAGAKGWIVKPFKADQLVATVKKLTAAA